MIIKMDKQYIQHLNFAEIIPFKNYSNLSNKKNSLNTFDPYYLDPFCSDPISFEVNNKVKSTRNKKGMVYTLPDEERKNLSFFVGKTYEETHGRFDVEYAKKSNDNVFYTEKDRHIKKHYGNPFSAINVHTYEKSITISDDKICLRVYRAVKVRRFNSKYFIKTTSSKTLTFNLKTGNFTISSIDKRKKTKKIFRKNNFNVVFNEFMRSFFETYIPNVSDKIKENEFKEKMSSTELLVKTNEFFGFNKNGTNPIDTTFFINDFISLFIEKRKIKIPNGNIKHYLSDLYPTEKFLKKNDRKLILSVLDMVGIKSKLTNKIFHQYPNLDLYGFFNICKILGHDYSKYVGNINEHCYEPSDKKLKKINEITSKHLYFSNTTSYELTNNEKENIVSVINSMGNTFFVENKYIVIMDHLNMINVIRKYDPTIFFKSKTKEQFTVFHSELAKAISGIKKGWVVEYLFSPKMVEDIEKPIVLILDNTSYSLDLTQITPESIELTFYPHILKREEEYEEEGSFMHHCVATYSNKQKSVIISIRTLDGSDRVTCEYNGQDGKLIQARHFCNGKVPEDMEVAIEKLTEKAKMYANLGMLHSIEQKKVPVRINGIDIIIERPTTPIWAVPYLNENGDLFF